MSFVTAQYPPILSLQGLSTLTSSELHSVKSELSSEDTLKDQQHNNQNTGFAHGKGRVAAALIVMGQNPSSNKLP